jgi:hypothetical protein
MKPAIATYCARIDEISLAVFLSLTPVDTPGQ